MTIKSSKTLVEEALKEVETYDSLKAKEMHSNGNCTLVDIRDIRELWNLGIVEDSMHIPRGMLEFWLDSSSPYYKKEKFGDETKKILLYCAGGLRSALAAKSLKDMGFNNIAHVDGGFEAMKQIGFKIIDKEKE
jgi:rhodanese-related sulfurtransferase